jgi:hypothetical protein
MVCCGQLCEFRSLQAALLSYIKLFYGLAPRLIASLIIFSTLVDLAVLSHRETTIKQSRIHTLEATGGVSLAVATSHAN